MSEERELRFEYMRPDQLSAALETFPVAYVPLGAIEYHGRALPVGLDGLKAHGILLEVARRLGGFVLPPLYYGTGGEHGGNFDWSWVVDEEALIALLLPTLQGLDSSGVKLIVLLTGHLPNDIVYKPLCERFAAAGGRARVLPLSDIDAFPKGDELHADHAAKWEGSWMLALEPGTVDLERVRPSGKYADIAAPEGSAGGWWFEREDPEHPWYGIAGPFGNRPDEASPKLASEILPVAVEYLCGQIQQQVREIGL